ncbi:hypothetical protein D3C79_1020130 [compost metagenome]
MADLVGHVVDEEGIPLRRGRARHAGRLLRRTEHPQPRQPTAAGVDHVADIEGAQPFGQRIGLHLHVDVGIGQA